MTSPRTGLTRRREALGLSKTRLAKIVGVNRTTVHRWESGDSDPMAVHRSPLARALQLSVIELTRLLDDEPGGGELASSSRSPQGASIDTVGGDEEGADDVHRRDFIAGIVATGFAAALPGSPGGSNHQVAALEAATERVVRLEQRSQYAALSALLPGLLSEATRTWMMPTA